jgi:hypothetical protein
VPGTLLRRFVAIASASTLSCGVVAVLSPAAHASASLSVVSQSTFLDSGGGRHIVGEIRNDGASSVELVQLDFDFLDASNTVQGTATTSTLVNRLAPGEISPFSEVFSPPAGYTHYTMAMSASDVTDPPNHAFTTAVTSTTTDAAAGVRDLMGTVRNDNTTDADFVELVFTYYNAAGTVVNADSVFADDDPVPAGQSSTFDETITTTPAYTRYSVLAQSTTPVSSPSAGGSPSPTPSPSGSGGASPSPSSGAADVTPTVSLSPAVISAGQKVTVTYTGAPGATLDIWSKTQPATAFSRIASVTLDSTGHGTSSHAPTKNTRIMAKTASGLASAQPLIQVRSVASLSAKRVKARTYTFSGRVYPARVSRLVSIYRNGKLVAQARTDASGVYGVTRSVAAGSAAFQARTGDDTYNLGATSPLKTYTVS